MFVLQPDEREQQGFSADLARCLQADDDRVTAESDLKASAGP